MLGVSLAWTFTFYLNPAHRTVQPYQILTNDGEMLIFCLSYFITTAIIATKMSLQCLKKYIQAKACI